MPNWCRNRVTVSGTEEDISKLSEIFSDTKSIFNHIIQSPDWKRLPNEKGQFPQLERMKNPKGEVMWETYNFPDGKNDDRWYHWNIQNWGTKWDVDGDIEFDVDGKYINMSFDTAWAPPEGIFNALESNEDFDLSISWFYDEPGMEFAGYLPD